MLKEQLRFGQLLITHTVYFTRAAIRLAHELNSHTFYEYVECLCSKMIFEGQKLC